MTTNNSTLLARVHYADKKESSLTKSLANLINFGTPFSYALVAIVPQAALGPLVGSKIASLASQIFISMVL